MQAVIVSVSYADFLSYTLPANLHQFKKVCVVTEEADRHTRALCEFYDVECVLAGGNKGAKINAGIERLDKSDWILQLDADVWLPPQTIRIIERKDLDKECLYGVDRAMCTSWKEFDDFLAGNEPVYPTKFFTVPPFPIGARVSQHYGYGYLPLGYFQLWHPLGSGVFSYPTDHGTEGIYARTDIQHAIKFARRELLAEPIVIHLEEGPAVMGANWNGRTTATFGNRPWTSIDGYAN